MNANLPTEKMATGCPEKPSWRVSTDTSRDPAWDGFLAGHPLGHFQQTSRWAQVKQLDGWQSIRTTFAIGPRIVGGFQILFKSSRAGRIGYVSKGPVLLPGHEVMADGIVEQLTETVRAHRIRALIVQPPDVCKVFPPRLTNSPFLRNRLLRIIEANCEVPVRGGFEVVERNMSATTRNKARQSARRGLMIRQGDREDLGTFFGLMLASCRRQGEHRPNPDRLELLEALWDNFHPPGHLWLDLAEIGGLAVAGSLCVAFGPRVTLWKKGWSGDHANLHPNHLLHYQAIRRAADQGYETFDFAAMSTDLACCLIEGRPISDRQKKSRDFFNLGFGGSPVLLPKARVMIPNLLLRSAYRVRLGLGRDHTAL